MGQNVYIAVDMKTHPEIVGGICRLKSQYVVLQTGVPYSVETVVEICADIAAGRERYFLLEAIDYFQNHLYSAFRSAKTDENCSVVVGNARKAGATVFR